MAHQFKLAPLGQIDLNGFPVNTTRERGRRALVTRAKKFIDSVVGRPGTEARDVAFSPEKGQGVGFLTGGARIVADTLYELYLRSPEDAVRAAITWAIEQLPDLVLDEYDLGNRRGPISQGAYQLGLSYFEASMDAALDEQRAAKAERKRAERRDRFRSANNRRGTPIGAIVGADVRKHVREAVNA